MGKIGLIIEREYMTRVKKKTFLLITLLGPVVMILGLSLALWLSLQETEDHHILVIDGHAPAFNSLRNKKHLEFTYRPELDLATAKQMLYETNFTGVLYIPPNLEFSRSIKLFYKKQPSLNILHVIENEVEKIIEEIQLDQYNIDREAFYKVNTDFNLTAVKYSESGEEEEGNSKKAVIGFIFGAMIYLFIFLYGVQVMRGVIEEKTNRIIEVIVTSVRPMQLMMGKILGVGLVSLTQFFFWILITMALFTVVQSFFISEFLDPASLSETVQATPEIAQQIQQEQSAVSKAYFDQNNILFNTPWVSLIAGFLFYFFGGYFLYSALFAAVGAAVDSETDTQQFMVPLTAPLTVAYISGVAIIQNPEGPVAFWLSMIPLTSPITMPIRMAVGLEDGHEWELFVSGALLIIFFLLTTWMAGRIYRTGILMYGKKASYKELWKWITYKSN
ncbi:ABC transporter permease [bacterium SCSIO 12741]|nr:ABC transporter permease [bacterium SCSIO 12741]